MRALLCLGSAGGPCLTLSAKSEQWTEHHSAGRSPCEEEFGPSAVQDKKGFFFINSTIGRHYFTTRALSHSFSDHCFTLNNGSFLPNFEFKQNTMTFTVT